MLNPLHILGKLKQQKKYYETQERAEKYFTAQVAALQGIKDTSGYKEIVRYWERVRELNVQLLAEANASDKEEVAKAQARLKQAQDFLSFLENVTGFIE